ncbi:MAG: anthranilate synthase component I [Pseudomonadota bacterium]
MSNNLLTTQIISQQISADLLTPVLALLKIESQFPSHHFLFESVEKSNNRGRYSIIGVLPDLIWKCENKIAYLNSDFEKHPEKFEKLTEHPIASLRELIKNSQIKNNQPVLSSGIFGYMSYDMGRLMEDLPDNNLPDEIAIPDSIFIRPQILIVFDGLFDVINIHAPIYKNSKIDSKQAEENIAKIIDVLNSPIAIPQTKIPSKPLNFKSNFSEEKYCAAVEKSQEYIKNGDIFQVLPSQRFTSDFDQENALAFYRSLRSINPSPFLFYIKFADFCLNGSSPEIMVSVKNKKVTVRPLAGTRKRGINAEDDKKIAEELLKDEKEVAEHLMLIDLGRHDVGRVCKAGTVKLTEKMVVENYSHVMHISSNVEGILDDKFDALDALISGFPAGTVSGAPKIRAMEIIEDLEKCKRSFYAGCVGYFAGNGDMETCITLRSALIKNNKIHLQAGAGVVFDSVPKSEYQECLNKAAALMKAAELV